MRFHLLFYVLLFTFYVLIALLGFSSISLAQEDTWTKKADMPTARTGLSASVVNGKIYAISGFQGLAHLSTVEEYDPKTDTWSKKADIPTARYAASASVVNRKIYVIGGWGGPTKGLPKTVEEYDPRTDTWTKKADMPTGREGPSTSVVNGKIYVIGGWDGSRNLSTVEEYDPATDTWTKKADLPTARYAPTSGVVNGKIYVIGGWDGSRSLSTVGEYDPATDTWTKRADMPTARHASALTSPVVNGKIYVVGGGGGLSKLEIYDPSTDTWTKSADMPTARRDLSASLVNGKIYAIGGQPYFGGPALSTVEEYDTGLTVDEVEEIIVDIYEVFPSFGDPKGGTTVRIQGVSFIPGSKVSFGGMEAGEVKVESKSLITAVVPPGSMGQVDVEVVSPDGKRAVLKNGFQYTKLKAIKITPESASIAGGITVQIEGFGFQSGVEVQVGGNRLTDLLVTPFSIRGTLPPGEAGVVDVAVINPNGEKDVLRRAFTYNPIPKIEEIFPIFVSLQGVFTEITIKGSGFIRTPTVKIGGVTQGVEFISSNKLQIPRNHLRQIDIGPQDVVVINPDRQRAVLPKAVTVLAPIKLRSVEPTSGSLEGGTKITIEGWENVQAQVGNTRKSYPSRFVDGVEVLIGKEKASDVTVVSDNIITAITPSNTSGPKNVEVINPDGQSAFLSDGFSYNPLPQIIKVIPNNGPLSGGTKITIQGSKFLPDAKVLIGDVNANSFIVASAPEVASDAFITAITPKVPLDEPGLRDVIVVNPDGQKVVLRDGYRYNPLPTIRDLSPSYGPSSGGTKVIIRGTGFLLGARVQIGKREATTQVKDDSTIEAVTPANPKGRLDVKVINPDTQEVVIQRGFVSVGELAYNYPNPFQASRGTTFRYVPGPNESVESIVVRIFNLAGVPIGVVGQEGSNEVRWQDSKVNVGLYVYLMEVKVGGQVKRFKRMLEVYK